MIIFFDLGNIFLNAKECGNLIIPNIIPLIVPIIEIITNINTIFAPQGPNKLFAAKSTCASPKLIIVSGPIYILIPIKYKTYTINMNIGAIISAFGKFLFESFISCDIEVETIRLIK